MSDEFHAMVGRFSEEGKALSKYLCTGSGSQYSREDHIEAVSHYLVTGNIREVYKLMPRVPEKTLQAWKRKEWWPLLLRELRDAKQDELDARLSSIIHKASDIAEDRLDNGQRVVDKNGIERQVPVSLKDAVWTAAVMFDKRQIMRNLPTSITQKADLSSLKEEFERLAGKTIEGERVDKGK